MKEAFRSLTWDRVTIFVVLYLALSYLALASIGAPDQISLLWPASGLTFAFALRYGLFEREPGLFTLVSIGANVGGLVAAVLYIRWRDEARTVAACAINLSAGSMHYESFAPFLRERLSRSSFPAYKIIFKIDGGFERDLQTSELSRSVIRAITEIAHVLKKTTVAEHCETEEPGTQLRALGVDKVQGFGIHRPQPIDDYFAA